MASLTNRRMNYPLNTSLNFFQEIGMALSNSCWRNPRVTFCHPSTTSNKSYIANSTFPSFTPENTQKIFSRWSIQLSTSTSVPIAVKQWRVLSTKHSNAIKCGACSLTKALMRRLTASMRSTGSLKASCSFSKFCARDDPNVIDYQSVVPLENRYSNSVRNKIKRIRCITCKSLTHFIICGK